MLTHWINRMCRPCLFGAALIVLPLLAPAAGSLIAINFADEALPDIHETNVAKPSQPYGVYDDPATLEARDRVAVIVPPPDPTVYALDWESRTDYDLQLLTHAYGWGLGWGYWDDGDVYDYRPLRSLAMRRAAHPTPPVPLPRYNLMEYNAALAQWRRDLEHAARRGHLPSAGKGARNAE